MVKGLVWTAEAETDFQNIVEYIKEEWGNGSAQKFVQTVFSRLDKLLSMPSIARFTNQENIQIYQLDKKNVVFFIVENEFIILLSIYPYKKDITTNRYF